MPNKNANRLNTEIVITNSWSDRATRIAELSDEVGRVTRAIPHASDAARRALDGENKKLRDRCDVLLDEVSRNQAEYLIRH